MKLKLLLLSTLLLVARLASAGDETALVGAGTAKCTKYLESSERGSEHALNVVASWTQGYFSAINVARMKSKLPLLKSIEPGQIRAWHERYCKLHPDDYLYESSDALFESL